MSGKKLKAAGGAGAGDKEEKKSKEIFEQFYTRTNDPSSQQCNLCPEKSKYIRQDLRAGYTNVLNHLKNDHPGFMDHMTVSKDVLIASKGRFGQASDKAVQLNAHLSWIIGDNLPLHFVESTYYRKYTNIGGNTSYDTMCKLADAVEKEVKKAVIKSFPANKKVVVLSDGWER